MAECLVCGMPRPHTATSCLRHIRAEHETLVEQGEPDQAEAWHLRTNAAHSAIPSDQPDR